MLVRLEVFQVKFLSNKRAPWNISFIDSTRAVFQPS
jgi:hypothetical protein